MLDFFALQQAHMRRMIADSRMRLKEARLGGGIWYATDYHQICQRKGTNPPINRAFFFHGFTAGGHFDFFPDAKSPSGKRIYTFVLRKGALPSSALLDLQKGPSLLDCGSVYYLASYLALLDVLGEKKFNFLFQAEGPFPLLLAGDEASTISRWIPKKGIQSEADVQEGDLCYFSNCKEYLARRQSLN